MVWIVKFDITNIRNVSAPVPVGPLAERFGVSVKFQFRFEKGAIKK